MKVYLPDLLERGFDYTQRPDHTKLRVPRRQRGYKNSYTAKALAEAVSLFARAL